MELGTRGDGRSWVAIELVLLDIGSDGGGDEVVDGQPAADAVADVGRGDVDEGGWKD